MEAQRLPAASMIKVTARAAPSCPPPRPPGIRLCVPSLMALLISLQPSALNLRLQKVMLLIARLLTGKAFQNQL